MRGARSKLLQFLAAATASAAAALALAGAAVGYSIWPLAGTGTPCATPPSCGDGGAATSAPLGFPEGVAVGPAGDVYVADWGDNEVRKLSVTGSITPVAGGGTPCSSPPACGDRGPATDAQLSFPDGVAVDQAGNVYIADTGDNEVRKVSPGGTITRFAGTGAVCASPPACGDGGAATAAQLRNPFGLAVDRSGDVYIADAGDNEIRKVTSAGKITRIAGTGKACSNPPACGDDGPATAGQLNFPAGVAVDHAGNVYVADDGDNEVRKVAVGGTISRIAGTGAACSSPPACGDSGPALSATLGAPDGVAVDQHANVYVADDLDNEIRKISVGRDDLENRRHRRRVCRRGELRQRRSRLDRAAQLPGRGRRRPGRQRVRGRHARPAAPLALGGPGLGAADRVGDGAAAGVRSAVARASVTVRYALSGRALRHAIGHAGRWEADGRRREPRAAPAGVMLTWNRRIDGAPAARGRYTLTVTATVGGRTATSRVGVKL